ncbi:MAG TPA: hypothetical protein VGR38_00450 [Candidatus Polarisedimenticolia bacterium]|nr:hypothetical protein [Candidatus Polarisedimenticolia bacterium]
MPFKRRSLAIFILVAGRLAMSSETRAATKEDLRISDFYNNSSSLDLPHGSSKKTDGAGRQIDNLLDGRTLPIPCASSLLQELRRHREALGDSARDALRGLSQRPSLPRDGNRLTRDGRYRIHFTSEPSSPDAIASSDRDFNGVPDVVDQVEEALERSETEIILHLGWPSPASGPQGDRYDVYLVNLGPGRQGLTVPDRDIPSTPQDDAFSHILLDSRLEGAAVLSAVAHQVSHASLLGLSTRSPAWWTEATAAWLEIQVTGDPAPHREALAARLERLDASLSSDSLLLSLGDLLWASYLAERREGKGEEVRQIWLELSLRGADRILPILDEVLRRNGQGDLQEAYREFTRWTLFTGPKNDGDHFRLGSLYPPIVPKATHAAFPVESAAGETVEPLGASLFRFVGDGTRGGLKIRFEGEASSPLQVDLVITPAGASHPHLVELKLDSRGHGEIGIPWRGVREAVMIVRHAAWEGAPARFRYSAQIDPLYPFELSSFGALPSPGGITLQWATATETDVLGWQVYRSEYSGGPFTRISPLALPSGADSQEETDYVYQDASVISGRRYYYLVEAITVLGLPERSFVVSARVSDERTQP